MNMRKNVLGKEVFSVPTKKDNTDSSKKIKITSLDHVKKGDDAFLYYSIKQQRKKALQGNTSSETKAVGSSSSSFSLEPSSSNAITITIERKTRISFESYPEFDLDEAFCEGDDRGLGESGDDLVEEIFDLLFGKST